MPVISERTCLVRLRLRHDSGQLSSYTMKPTVLARDLWTKYPDSQYGRPPMMLSDDNLPRGINQLTFARAEEHTHPTTALGKLFRGPFPCWCWKQPGTKT